MKGRYIKEDREEAGGGGGGGGGGRENVRVWIVSRMLQTLRHIAYILYQ